MHPAIFVFGILLFAIIFIIIKIIISRSSPVVSDTVNLCISQNDTINSDFIVSNYLDRLEANHNSCDAQIITENNSNRVHSVLISAYSEYFEKIFIENQLTAELPASFSESVKDFIHFVYDDGKLPSETENKKQLLRFAEIYNVPSMKCSLEKLLRVEITNENALELMKLSNETNSKFLSLAVSYYIVDHIDVLAKQKRSRPDLVDCFSLAIDLDKRDEHQKFVCDIKCSNVGLNSPQIINRLKRSFLIEQFTNAELIMTNHSFKINKNILIDQSDVWREAFTGRNVVELPYVADFYTVKQFLIYMYSSWLPELNINTEKIFTIANQFGMHPLKSACEDLFLNRLNVENAADILLLSSRVESIRLKTEALNYFFANLIDIKKTKGWKELKENNPEAVTKILINI